MKYKFTNTYYVTYTCSFTWCKILWIGKQISESPENIFDANTVLGPPWFLRDACLAVISSVIAWLSIFGAWNREFKCWRESGKGQFKRRISWLLYQVTWLLAPELKLTLKNRPQKAAKQNKRTTYSTFIALNNYFRLFRRLGTFPLPDCYFQTFGGLSNCRSRRGDIIYSWWTFEIWKTYLQ
jgi:hypothetical protein